MDYRPDESPIYLDHAATTPLSPSVAEAMREAALRFPANPASQHGPGRAARQAVELARRRIGDLLGAELSGRDADQLIFTSGGTEANNLALRGLAGGGDVLVSAAEHPSVAAVAAEFRKHGRRIELIPLDRNGVVRVDRLAERLSDGDVDLVAVQLGSNETGVLQPIAQVAALCRDHGAQLHTDAVQAVGKIDVNFRELGATTLSCAAHKFHGPVGIGALVVRDGTPLRPLLFGGHQQAGLRPGTENVTLAVGMQAALEAFADEAAERCRRLAELRDHLESTLAAQFVSATVVGGAAPRLPHIANVAFRGVDRQALAMALDLAGVACSTGSACASGSSEPSPTLVAMQLDDDVISGSLRLSLAATTSAAEIDQAARRILSVVNDLRTRSSA